MGWAIKIADVEYRIEDLPINRLQLIANARGVGWYWLIQNPGANALAYVDLLQLVTELHPDAGRQEIEVGSSGAAVIKLLDLLVQVDDDLPTDFVDGIPKMEEPATT